MSERDPDVAIRPPTISPDPGPSADAGGWAGDHEAGVPRRFGVGTLLLITAMYAVLFAVLRAVGAPPSIFLVVALFFTSVGLGQMLLYKGRRPRRASMVAGAWCGAALGLLNIVLGHRLPVAPFDPLEGAIGGAIYGYLAGTLIAGVFLFVGKGREPQDKCEGADPHLSRTSG